MSPTIASARHKLALAVLTPTLLLAVAPGGAQAATPNQAPECKAVVSGGAGLSYFPEDETPGKVESGERERVNVICKDPERQPVTFSRGAGPAHGSVGPITVRDDGPQDTPTATFLYRSKAGYLGKDRFVIRASDGTNTTKVVVRFTVVAAQNDPPVCNGNAGILDGEGYFKAPSGQTVNGDIFCSDDEGKRLKFAVVTPPAHGTLGPFSRLNEYDRQYGQFTYTSDAGYGGRETFRLSASDGPNTVFVDYEIRVIVF